MNAGILALGVGAAIAAIAFGRRPAIEAEEREDTILDVKPPWQSKTTPTPIPRMDWGKRDAPPPPPPRRDRYRKVTVSGKPYVSVMARS